MLKLPKRGGNLRVTGCLPFTCTNHLVQDVGKWFAKLRTDKFHPTIAFTIVQISSIYWKTAAKAWNWYQRWLWRNGIQISVWNIPSRKTRLPFRCSRCSLKFSIGKTQRVLFHLFSNQISQKIFVNGKQPLSVFSPIFVSHKIKDSGYNNSEHG